DCRPRDAVAEIIQRTLDARVAPAGILAGHPYHEAPDLQEHARTSGPTPRVCPFPGDQLPVPPEDCVGRDDGGHLRQTPTAEPFAEDCQPSTFIVSQSESSSAQLRLQNPVFCSEILQGLLLLVLHPTDDDRQHQLKRKHPMSLRQPPADQVFGHFGPKTALSSSSRLTSPVVRARSEGRWAFATHQDVEARARSRIKAKCTL